MLTKLGKKWKLLGPGFITGSSDDDPSGIATYTQAGAGFGLSLLWTALITFPLMVSIQEMCARIGIVTSHGLAYNIKKYCPQWMFYTILAFNFFAVCFNIGANLAAMGAVSNLLFPAISPFIFSFFFTVFLIFTLIYFSYKRIANLLKWLCLTLGVYLIVPFFVHQDWPAVFTHTFLPHIESSESYISTLVAILGTTISPYLFFWQTSMSVEDKNHQAKLQGSIQTVKHEVENMHFDVNIGMIFSNLIMFAIILTAGSVLFPQGIHTIETVEQAAQALRPLMGEYAYILFSIGIITTGLLSVPVLAGSLAYILADTFHWKKGMDKKIQDAKEFYATMSLSMLIGLGINAGGLDPIKSLIYTAIIYGVSAPPLIAIILYICNQRKIMGAFVNSRWSNALGVLTLVLMTVSACVLCIHFFI